MCNTSHTDVPNPLVKMSGCYGYGRDLYDKKQCSPFFPKPFPKLTPRYTIRIISKVCTSKPTIPQTNTQLGNNFSLGWSQDFHKREICVKQANETYRMRWC